MCTVLCSIETERILIKSYLFLGRDKLRENTQKHTGVVDVCEYGMNVLVSLTIFAHS